MIGHDLRNNRLDFGSDWVKGQGQGHKKVKNVFLRYLSYFLSDLHETNVKISRIQFPIPRYATGYGVVHSFFSGWGQMSRGSRPFKMCVLRYNSVNSGPIWTKATHKFPIFYAPSNSDGICNKYIFTNWLFVGVKRLPKYPLLTKNGNCGKSRSRDLFL